MVFRRPNRRSVVVMDRDETKIVMGRWTKIYPPTFAVVILVFAGLALNVASVAI
tara:strand:- start:1572 stop:1733 length:162 start_codon:yes stop_codon:yes gene_type:complete